MLVGYTVKLLAIVALYWYMYSENKRRDRLALETVTSEDGVEAGMLVCFCVSQKCRNLLTEIGSNGNR